MDYVFVPKSRLTEFTQAIQKTLHKWYGANPQQSKDYGRIVNERHFDRLIAMLHNRETGQILIGGESDRSTRYIAPTVVTDVDFFDSKLMGDEIFGPILPVITYNDIEETMGLISKQ